MTTGLTNSSIATAWRAQVTDPSLEWRRTRNQAQVLPEIVEGECGGFAVDCAQIPGRRCYMKPRIKDRHCRAAREKIASDLAHDLDVAVPPVLLAYRRDAGHEEEHVMVSLIMYPTQASWDQASRLMGRSDPVGAAIRGALPLAAGRAWAFDTWLGQRDHDGTVAHNIIFGYDPAEWSKGALVFLDYAFSCGHLGRWADGKDSDCEVAGFPPALSAHASKDAIGETIDRIETVTDADLEVIVSRIPVSHMDSDTKGLVVEGLKKRRHLVRQAFEEAGILG